MKRLGLWVYWGLVLLLAWQHWEFGALGLAIAFLQIMQTKVRPTTSRTDLYKSLDQLDQIIGQISDRPLHNLLQEKAHSLRTDLEQNYFYIAVFGMGSVGKTSVINALIDEKVGLTSITAGTTKLLRHYTYDKLTNLLGSKCRILLMDTPGLQSADAMGEQQEAIAIRAAETADLVIFVTDCDLGAIATEVLTNLAAMGKPMILAFNKTDQYLPPDRAAILTTLQAKTAKFLSPDRIVAIAAAPIPITVRQYNQESPNYLEQEWQEAIPPDIAPLKNCLENLLAGKWEQLLLKNCQSKLQQLQAIAQTSLQKSRREQGHKIIRQYQWLNGATLFANPIPALDLIAGIAINAKLLIELAQIYDRRLGLKEAQAIALNLIEILIKLGCVEIATVAIATQASYFLKASTITYAIGGGVQAVSAAYLTHVGGVSFLDYLELSPEPSFTIKGIQEFCRTNFAKMQDQGFISSFVASFIGQFPPTSILKTDPLLGRSPEP